MRLPQFTRFNDQMEAQNKVGVDNKKEVFYLARNGRSIMSDRLKWEIAKELGVDRIVAAEGFGGVSSRNCGLMVRKAIEMAERQLAGMGPEARNPY